MRKSPDGGGLSRTHILSQVDESLKRLGIDRIDLYIFHRWDYHTPIEGTLETLHNFIKVGRAMYLGASAMYAW